MTVAERYKRCLNCDQWPKEHLGVKCLFAPTELEHRGLPSAHDGFFRCWNCDKLYTQSGIHVRCPGCNAMNRVPL